MSSQLLLDALPFLTAFILALFFPAAAWSFHELRMPKKKEEMGRICSALGLSQDIEHCPYGLFKTYEDTTGRDYFLPVAFCFVFALITLSLLFSPQVYRDITGNPESQINLLLHTLGEDNSTAAPIIGSESLRSALIWGAKPMPVPGNMDQQKDPLPVHALGNLTMILMAALGCFVWTLLYIGRRLYTLDLSPNAFFSVATRMVFASFIALCVRHVLVSMGANTSSSSMPALAFFIGMFPERGLHYLKETFGKTWKSERRTRELPLGMIQGINLFTKTRLSEINIDNAQNLAEANFVEMLLRTPFNPWRIMDWIAQAKLYVHVPAAMEDLRTLGVRTVFDFKAVTRPSWPRPSDSKRRSTSPRT